MYLSEFIMKDVNMNPLTKLGINRKGLLLKVIIFLTSVM